MKRIITILAGISLLASGARADEGMWLPSLISQRFEDMKAHGFKLTAEDIYSVNQASLKDAVLLFGTGCTGELVSKDGLLFTNYHCGYSMVQSHSSVEHDYLRDGFWAKDRESELKCPGLTIRILDHMTDVTDKVLAGYDKSMSEEQRVALVKKNSEALVKEAEGGNPGLSALVETFYYGNQYFLFVYRKLTDIRLVGAPPSSIGKFGGDTDNWVWPRHTGDFAIFRAYENGEPYHPRRYFKLSTAGVKEGDFTFVYGFPGRTKEYITSDAVRYTSEIADPNGIDIRTMRLDIQRKYMSASQDVRIRYSAKNQRISNAWKKWQGEVKGIRKMNTVENKKAYEAAFREWAKGSDYEGLLDNLADVHAKLEPCATAHDLYNETAANVELANYAKGSRKDSAWFYKNYYQPIDEESFVAMMTEFGKRMPKDLIPTYYSDAVNYYGSVQAWSDAIFADKSLILAAEFATKMEEWHNKEIMPEYRALNNKVNLLMRDYMRGQMEFSKDKSFYPDANLTLRVAYGKVSGYSPADGIWYKPTCTVAGIMEKDNPEIFDYNIPQSLRDLNAHGEYNDNPACFIATNHTTGGNSGSPVIDANGNLIGINFDRVWEGTMSDIVYDPEICRNICLDVRYLIFVVDKVCGAGHILDEIEFVR